MHLMRVFDKFKFAKKSFSQCGEDLIVDFLMHRLNIYKPYYLDIGAHHPYNLSNTAIFYQRGCNGIVVEADPTLFQYIKKIRKSDICLNLAVSDGKKIGKIDFYIMNVPTLNTTSYDEVCRIQGEGYKINKKIQVECIGINELLSLHAKQRPNFISIDAEGVDEIIIDTLDFCSWGPEVICLETLQFASCNPLKNMSIIQKICQKGYSDYADTFINTIFLKERQQDIL